MMGGGRGEDCKNIKEVRTIGIENLCAFAQNWGNS